MRIVNLQVILLALAVGAAAGPTNNEDKDPKFVLAKGSSTSHFSSFILIAPPFLLNSSIATATLNNVHASSLP